MTAGEPGEKRPTARSEREKHLSPALTDPQDGHKGMSSLHFTLHYILAPMILIVLFAKLILTPPQDGGKSAVLQSVVKRRKGQAFIKIDRNH